MIPIAYNVRNLAVRKATTIGAALGLALVVFVVAGLLMLSNGIERTLGRSGAPDRVVVLRKGSDTEMVSSLDLPTVSLVLAAPGVARASGQAGQEPDGAGELLVVIILDKLGTSGVTNVQVRGVSPKSAGLRPEVKVVEGRSPRPGTDEVMVGQAIRGRFKGTALGGTFELKKNRPVTVVGVFEAAGSALESEVWADEETIRSAFGRTGFVSGVHARLESPRMFDAFKAYVEENRQLGLLAQREIAYYEKQSEGTALFVRGVGIFVTVFFAIGAMIGAMITMYASVANRQREIGTLRALGFSKLSIVTSFLLESILLAILGGVVGLLGSLALGFVRFSMINFATWSEVVFRFEPTPGILVTAMVVAAAMGLVGGLMPAIRAARMSPVNAMRD